MSTPRAPPKKPPKVSCYPSGNFSLLPTRYVPNHAPYNPPKFSRRIPTSFQLIPVTYPASALQEERSPTAEGNTNTCTNQRVSVTFVSSSDETPTITLTPPPKEISIDLDRRLRAILKIEGYDSDSGVAELDQQTIKELLVLADLRESCDWDCEWADTLRRVERETESETEESVIWKKKVRSKEKEGRMLIKLVLPVPR